jgi:dihydroorotase
VIGFSDDGSPVHRAELFRNALAYAGMLGLPLVDHPEDLELTAGAEANDGLIATVLGLKGWPGAAESSAVARDIALLADVVAEVPAARLHLTHLSTAASIEHVRRAKAAGLPVTCDVTPHHLVLTDEWIAGARRWAWGALDGEGRARDPWRDGALVAGPYDTTQRVNPPLRSAVDARACLAGLLVGTVDAVATDHAPHTEVDKDVEFGLAKPGIAGIETALGAPAARAPDRGAHGRAGAGPRNWVAAGVHAREAGGPRRVRSGRPLDGRAGDAAHARPRPPAHRNGPAGSRAAHRGSRPARFRGA